MILSYSLALAAAFSWALASLISVDIARALGGISFNRIRLIIVTMMLVLYSSLNSTWSTINNDLLMPIIISGFIGVFLGDTLLFIALKTIGPRRNNILFALAAPFTVILNIFFLQQNMSIAEIAGCMFVFIGVIIAIIYGSSKTNKHRWEKIEGSINIGIVLGILAALCQAIGIIIMKPVLDEGADPIASAAIRTGISAFALSVTYFFDYEIFRDKTKINFNIIIKTIISGFLGMALGMSLLLIALKKGDAGIVATLSSTSPIMILFLIWFLTKKVPVLGAWIGSFIAILGAGLIFVN
ncbi:MAG: EamA family transporter [Pelagibacteraceae bacterium]|nr:EamA family transporter [Pelagibacteraceae bacterium]|tara:strand:+ start:12038 stop:12931 length:894 start_codon:yes stop_codon:yes gene_type:complete